MESVFVFEKKIVAEVDGEDLEEGVEVVLGLDLDQVHAQGRGQGLVVEIEKVEIESIHGPILVLDPALDLVLALDLTIQIMIRMAKGLNLILDQDLDQGLNPNQSPNLDQEVK